MHAAAKRSGLALVNVLVVIAIAAVALTVLWPQITEPAGDDRMRTAEYNLATMRAAIETYRSEHAGRLPSHDSCADLQAALTMKTRSSGTVDPAGSLGPYLSGVLVNPITEKSTVRTTDRARLDRSHISDPPGGWLYNPTSGQLFLDSDPGFDL